MTQFEFVFVIASIVVALSLTRLFDGLGQTLQKKMSGGPVDAVQVTFGAFVTALLLVVWWALFRWKNETDWNFLKFLTITMYMASFYALASVLYPRKADVLPNFAEIRKTFYLILAANLSLEIFDTYLLGTLFSPWYFLLITGHMALLCLIGLAVRNRKYDLFVGLWFLSVIVIWPFAARFTV